MAAMPTIQITARMGIQICRGLALYSAVGMKVSAMASFTTVLTGSMPVWTVGVGSVMSWGVTTSALGIRLRALSMEKGHSSRTATSPHSSTLIHLGAFFSRNRAAMTASTSQLAEKDRLTIFKKTSVNALTLSIAVDHGLHGVDLVLRDLLGFGESGHKGWEAALEGALHELLQF